MKKDKASFKQKAFTFVILSLIASAVIAVILYLILNKSMITPLIFASAHVVGVMASSASLFANTILEFNDRYKLYLVIAIYNLILSFSILITTSFLYTMITFVLSTLISIFSLRGQLKKFYGRA